jgi:Calponin homology (CH) domain
LGIIGDAVLQMIVQGLDALLHWCKTHTNGYPDVLVQNFNTSWRDGLALCALIHKFHPESLEFNALSKDDPLSNLEKAFSLAEQLGMLCVSQTCVMRASRPL